MISSFQGPVYCGDIKCLELPHALGASHPTLRHKILPWVHPIPPTGSTHHPVPGTQGTPSPQNGHGREWGSLSSTHQGPCQEPHAAQGKHPGQNGPSSHGSSPRGPQERSGLLLRSLCCGLDHFRNYHVRYSARHRTQVHGGVKHLLRICFENKKKSHFLSSLKHKYTPTQQRYSVFICR